MTELKVVVSKSLFDKLQSIGCDFCIDTESLFDGRTRVTFDYKTVSLLIDNNGMDSICGPMFEIIEKLEYIKSVPKRPLSVLSKKYTDLNDDLEEFSMERTFTDNDCYYPEPANVFNKVITKIKNEYETLIERYIKLLEDLISFLSTLDLDKIAKEVMKQQIEEAKKKFYVFDVCGSRISILAESFCDAHAKLVNSIKQLQ